MISDYSCLYAYCGITSRYFFYLGGMETILAEELCEKQLVSLNVQNRFDILLEISFSLVAEQAQMWNPR